MFAFKTVVRSLTDEARRTEDLLYIVPEELIGRAAVLRSFFTKAGDGEA